VAKQVAVDPATQQVYVVGDWEGNLTSIFPPDGTKPSTFFTATYGLMDGFVAKFDQDGNFMWAFKVGGENDDQVNSIAVDQAGNVYITGMMGEGASIYFSGTSPHSGSSTLSNASGEDFFLAKFNPDGEFLWVRRSDTNSGDLSGQDLTLTTDAVFAVGNASALASFDSIAMVTNPTGQDFFLIKYSLDGGVLWIAESGSNGTDQVKGLVADETQVFYIGHFDGSNFGIRDATGLTIASEGNMQNGTSDIILAAYDHAGVFAWSHNIGSTDHDEGHGITQDADSLYITGAIENNSDFPGYAGNPLSTSAQKDIFLASLAKSDGITGWVQVLPSSNPGDEFGRSMDMDAFGNLYVTGDYNDNLQFPQGVTLSSLGVEDVFVAAFTAYGDFRWAESIGSSQTDKGNGIAIGSGGSMYISGQHDGLMNLGSLTLMDNPDANAYLAKLQDTIPSLPLADPGPYGDVCGFSLGLQAIPSSGVGAWSQVSGPGNATFTPSENAPTVSVEVDQFGTYNFTWTETNLAGSDDSLFTVEFYEPILANAGHGGDTCGSDFQLAAVPSIGTGSWTLTGGPGTASFNPSADAPDAIVSVDLPGMYLFTWTESNGTCSDQDSIDVNFLDNLVVDAGPDIHVCGMEHDMNVLPQDIPGTWITVNGTGFASFIPSDTVPVARVTVDAYGEYLFKWEARQGFCSGEDSVLVSFHREPFANAGPDQVLDYRFTTNLAAELLSADVAEVNASGTWTLVSGSGLIENTGDPATRVTELQVGDNVFEWTISSTYCPDVSDQVTITVNDIETYTVITPNNDGFNDFLAFPGVEELRGCEIIIYNRWGMEVYRNADYQNDWDGRDHNDRELIPDTYYYILRIPPDRIIKSFVEIRRSQ
jgi:gliding motility-associated-like protein